MSDELVASVIVLFAGIIPGFVLGYLVVFKQKWNLIAGWDESKISNPKAFADIVGWSIIVMSLALAFATLLWVGGIASEYGYVVLLLLASVIPIASVFYAKLKYSKSAH